MDNEKLINEVEEYNDKKVWVTKKCRINAETRYLRYHSQSQFLLNWYSISTLALSVITLYSEDNQLDLVNVLLSIVLLGASLMVTGFRFEDIAKEHKKSYTSIMAVEEKLNTLRKKISSQQETSDKYTQQFAELKQEYISILENTPNHKDIDYIQLSANTKKLSFSKRLIYELRRAGESLLFIGLILFPLVLGISKLIEVFS